MKFDAKTIIIIVMIGVIIAIIFQRQISFASEMEERRRPARPPVVPVRPGGGRPPARPPVVPTPVVPVPTAPRDPWTIIPNTNIVAAHYFQGYGPLDSCTELCKNDVNCKAFIRTSASDPSDPNATCALFNMTNPPTTVYQNVSTYIKNV